MPPECVRCLLPEGQFNVVLQEDGLCNYCTYYEKQAPLLANPDLLRPRFLERIEAVKGRYEYDAMVGLSGGKDSTYVLYKLVKDYGLKVLAFTYDNGFLTDHGKENIQKAVSKLGVDHFFHCPDWSVHKKLYQATVMKLGDPCLACAFAGFFLTLKLCYERRIPFFVAGRSTSQIFRNFYEGSKDLFIPMMNLNVSNYSMDEIATLYRSLNESILEWVAGLFDDKRDIDAMYREFFVETERLTSEFCPEIVSFFLYEPYDEESIKQEIERALDYRRASNDELLSHLDCKIVDVANHLYRQVHGLSILAQEVAVMLRRGELDIDRAKKLLSDEPEPAALRESTHALCSRVEIDESELAAAVERVVRSQPQRPEGT